MVNKKKEPAKIRARTAKGKFIADDPNTPENEAYVQKKPKIIRKVKQSGVVKLKPSIADDIKKAKVGRPIKKTIAKVPTKEEAYTKHIKEATSKSQKKNNGGLFRDKYDAFIDTIKSWFGAK